MSDGWSEVLVGADLREVVVAVRAAGVAGGPRSPAGARVTGRRARPRRWVTDAVQAARTGDGGRVVTFDYCTTTAELAARPATGPHSWLRTFRAHRPRR